jgi:putative transposase
MNNQRAQQTDLFPKQSKSYGGILLNKRKNRTYARPISTSRSMHLVLRSSKAVKDKSFKTPKNKKLILQIFTKFSIKYGLQIISLANVGTHLHLHIKVAKRAGYLRFIRAVTAAIAMGVSGRNRWTVGPAKNGKRAKEKFWDYRPFTRIIEGFRALLHLRDYVQINQLEGLGLSRLQARMMLANSRPDKC